MAPLGWPTAVVGPLSLGTGVGAAGTAPVTNQGLQGPLHRHWGVSPIIPSENTRTEDPPLYHEKETAGKEGVLSYFAQLTGDL